MRRNPQLIHRDGSILRVRLDRTEPIAEEDIQDAILNGYHILVLDSGNGNMLFRKSKQCDDFIRSTEGVVWTPDSVLFPFESDRGVWRANVQWWFFNAIENSDYVNEIMATFNVTYETLKATMIDAMNWMAHQHPKKRGGQGKRRPDLDAWLRSDRRPAFDRFLVK